MKKLLYVVHRYPPFAGGSEYYVQAMAEESLRQGCDVTVLAGQHGGDLNGIKLTSRADILAQPFDAIIVHGGDVQVQNFVLAHAPQLPSPVLYMLILPSESKICVQALQDCRWLGYSTLVDQVYLEKHGVRHKGVYVPHGIDARTCTGQPGFRAKYGITTPHMFISCGGYWPHKAMRELVALFHQLKRDDVTLVLTGYDNRSNTMPERSERVLPLLLDDKQEVKNGILEADLLLLHSFEEGFGLVLLEAMLNRTQWAGRHIAGAATMADNGFTYTDDATLLNYLEAFTPDSKRIEQAYEYVTHHHLIEHTVAGILKALA